MDMRVNPNLIKAEREKRAWSQEHLASVTGLGLRTINRIETSGKASPESVKALASVFEVQVSALQVTLQTVPAHIRFIRGIGRALITPIQLIDRTASARTNWIRLIITFSCLLVAAVFYMLEMTTGFLIFLLPAIILELTFYYRLIYKSRPYA